MKAANLKLFALFAGSSPGQADLLFETQPASLLPQKTLGGGEFLCFWFPRPNILFASWISWVSPLSWRECVNLEEAAKQQGTAHVIQALDEAVLVIDGCWGGKASICKDISLCLYSTEWPYTHAHMDSTKRTLHLRRQDIKLGGKCGGWGKSWRRRSGVDLIKAPCIHAWNTNNNVENKMKTKCEMHIYINV